MNVRILADTTCDLEQAVSQGSFRRDLYFRLNVLSLRIPPLRERRQDIPLLVAHFLDPVSRSSGQEHTLSDDALKAMLEYDWPGNLRELENCLDRSCAMSTGPMIHVADLPSASLFSDVGLAFFVRPGTLASPQRRRLPGIARGAPAEPSKPSML